MRFLVLTALFLLALAALLVGCAGGEKGTDEFTAPTEQTEIVKETTEGAATPETTEVASAQEDDRARCEAQIYDSGQPQAIQAWETASEEEKNQRCARLLASAPSDPSAPPDYELAEIGPGKAATDLTQGKAIVYVTNLGNRSYGQVVNGPLLQQIADRARADNPEYEVLVVDLYSGTKEAPGQLLGSRYSFESPAAERKFLQQCSRGLSLD